jgi:hypothetical protein
MLIYKNKPQDLKINYKVNTYDYIEKIFDLREGELPLIQFFLALLGVNKGNKVGLDKSDNSGQTHEFSLRTVYQRNESDYDSFIGLISILDNLELSYEEVINQIAFERTEMNDKQFLKMTNVKTFFEYMLSGLDSFEELFLHNGEDTLRVAESIHEFLQEDIQDIDLLLEALLDTEEVE